ncbi:unnamed protein product [Spirodela intermedia]|uniref:Major facilitator superfamily (MFS) profile domain-containing protein n=1 Tax=Spirodela intermedia TaxID=51605 RepID=A0A7I8IG31_SPIIN|nr:unnamed protein product [Spirodela intermedia]CAA6656033.1 unnamed protein product [Spirodela intermedia]
MCLIYRREGVWGKMEELARLYGLFVCVFLYNFSAYMVSPVITDVTMAAICPGRDRCSLAILLRGLQQAITGMGTLLVTPCMGSLSDRYGRKALLAVPMALAAVPPAILSCNRTQAFFYVYYVVNIFTGVICDGSLQCLPIAYVADEVGERRRASAIGMLSGVAMVGFVAGILTSRFLSTTVTFRVAATMAVFAALYARVLLVESCRPGGASTSAQSSQSIPTSRLSGPEPGGEPPLLPSVKAPLSLRDLTTSFGCLTFSRAAVVAFLSSLGEGGLQASLLYYLKARFNFSKDQFADILLIGGIAGAISQLFLMPLLVPTVGEDRLLSVGLLASFINIFLYSIAWASWVPYMTSVAVAMTILCQPCIRTIVSKEAEPSEQGAAQACISAVCSFANILSPLAFTPLTALFLSEAAPFNFPGFGLLCVGIAPMAAFIQSLAMARSQLPPRR